MLTYLKICLRTALRRLLEADQPKPVLREPYLDVLLQGRSGPLLSKYLIIGTIGTRLQGIPVNGGSNGVRLICEAEAVDKKLFQDLWQQFGGKQLKLVWEDTMEQVQ